jgi:hypothetical protein
MQGEKTTCLLQLQKKLPPPQTTAPNRPREVAQLKQARYLRFTHKAYNK